MKRKNVIPDAIRNPVLWVVVFALCLFSLYSLADAKIAFKIYDRNGKLFLDTFLYSLGFDVSSSSMVVTLDDVPVLPVQPAASIQVTIDGVQKPVQGIGVQIYSAPTPAPSVPSQIYTAPLPPAVSLVPIPAPVPSPTTRPTGPFPQCSWGPAPTDASQLLEYIDGMGEDLLPWENWLKAHPEDLGWAWSEYKKTNPNPNP